MYNYIVKLWKSFFCNNSIETETEIDKMLMIFDLPLGIVFMSMEHY